MCSDVSLAIQSDAILKRIRTAATAAGSTTEPDTNPIDHRVLIVGVYFSSLWRGII